jgi:hypothetical protein
MSENSWSYCQLIPHQCFEIVFAGHVTKQATFHALAIIAERFRRRGVHCLTGPFSKKFRVAKPIGTLPPPSNHTTPPPGRQMGKVALVSTESARRWLVTTDARKINSRGLPQVG